MKTKLPKYNPANNFKKGGEFKHTPVIKIQVKVPKGFTYTLLKSVTISDSR